MINVLSFHECRMTVSGCHTMPMNTFLCDLNAEVSIQKESSCVQTLEKNHRLSIFKTANGGNRSKTPSFIFECHSENLWNNYTNSSTGTLGLTCSGGDKVSVSFKRAENKRNLQNLQYYTSPPSPLPPAPPSPSPSPPPQPPCPPLLPPAPTSPPSPPSLPLSLSGAAGGAAVAPQSNEALVWLIVVICLCVSFVFFLYLLLRCLLNRPFVYKQRSMDRQRVVNVLPTYNIQSTRGGVAYPVINTKGPSSAAGQSFKQWQSERYRG